MAVTCCSCRHAAARDHTNPQRDATLKAMAKRGMLNCLKSNCRASFQDATRERDCDLFEATDKTTADKRRTFFIGIAGQVHQHQQRAM